MSIKARLIASGSEREYFSVSPGGGVGQITGTELLPVVANFRGAFGLFKAVTRTTAGTTIITEPDPGGSIIITDLIINAGKFSSGSTTVRYTDGANIINITVMDNTDAPLSLGIAFAGRWQGWKDARLEVVTVNDVLATVAVGYLKFPEGLGFSEWDALR